MNGVKGKFLQKLKSMKPPIGYLKQDRILQAFSPDGYSDFFSRNNNLKAKTTISSPDGVEDEETEFDFEMDDKENIEPLCKLNGYGNSQQSKGLRARNCSDSEPENCTARELRQTPLLEIDISSFRPPDMNSGSLFDPNLLAVFHQAVMEHMKIREAEIKCRIINEEEGEEEDEEEEEEEKPLFGFRENCPPGGSEAVILSKTLHQGQVHWRSRGGAGAARAGEAPATLRRCPIHEYRKNSLL